MIGEITAAAVDDERFVKEWCTLKLNFEASPEEMREIIDNSGGLYNRLRTALSMPMHDDIRVCNVSLTLGHNKMVLPDEKNEGS